MQIVWENKLRTSKTSAKDFTFDKTNHFQTSFSFLRVEYLETLLFVIMKQCPIEYFIIRYSVDSIQ